MSMLNYPIPIGTHALSELQSWLEGRSYSQVLVLCDENTFRHCYPRINAFLPPHHFHIIPPGEQHKTLVTCQQIWETLTRLDVDRKALMINLGGGVVGDMGGFVAGTYKRGIDFVQVPTTLLAQVDASVGGKVGIDFQQYKNQLGLFLEPQGVFIWPAFLETLSEAELRSGFAEVIKHHLIADGEGWESLRKLRELSSLDLPKLIQHSVNIKAKIVAEDFRESGSRKSLNFGHTIGHALESHRLESAQPLRHGEAIAVGMVAEAQVSQAAGLLSSEDLANIRTFVRHFFPTIDLSEQEIPEILKLMQQDKKNEGKQVRCTLIQGPGQFQIDHPLTEAEAKMGLAYYMEA
jgi:3-dehydroquinate synthase